MSGRKNTLLSFKIINAGDMSLASITSTVTNIQYLDNICIEVNFTGSPVGTFAIQGSLSYAQDAFGNVINAGTWNDLVLPTTPAAAGVAGSFLFDLNQLSFPWIRVVYTKGSGTGTLDGYVGGKMV